MSDDDRAEAQGLDVRALQGLRVLDIGHWLAGPFGTTLLGDFGAEVIKVERPGGQNTPMRSPVSWSVENRNKRSITLALDHPKGQALFKELVKHIDVVTENFVPGTLEKWGLGYADLAAVNERVILVRVSGFGQTGPYRDRKSFDRLGIAMGGLTYTTGFPDGPPIRPGFMVADYGTGLMNAFATLIAVYNRDVVGTGKGQEVDVSLYETIFRLSGPLIANYDVKGVIRERSGNLVPGISPGDQFQTSDGRWVVIHAGADHHFRALMQAVGFPEIAQDERFSRLEQRVPHMEFLNSLVGQWVSQHPLETVMETILDAGVAIAPVYSARDIAEDPHYAAREAIVTVEDPVVGPVKQPAPLPKLSRTPGRIYNPAPSLGEHNAEIYGGLLGLSEEQICTLADECVI
jgi:crotonobetainyl-CoA:carnitine CoA-transferase CaiB-like acyl-CoA transferase